MRSQRSIVFRFVNRTFFGSIASRMTHVLPVCRASPIAQEWPPNSSDTPTSRSTHCLKRSARSTAKCALTSTGPYEPNRRMPHALARIGYKSAKCTVCPLTLRLRWLSLASGSKPEYGATSNRPIVHIFALLLVIFSLEERCRAKLFS
jgi:hypothetical protein